MIISQPTRCFLLVVFVHKQFQFCRRLGTARPVVMKFVVRGTRRRSKRLVVLFYSWQIIAVPLTDRATVR